MNLSYNVSDHLKTYLDKIEKLRSDVALYPLSPKNELRLKWDASMERIIWALALTNSPISKTQIIKILKSTSHKKRLSKEESDVLGLRDGMRNIRENWMVTKNSVTQKTIKDLYEISCKPSMGKMTGMTELSRKQIETVLTYIENGHDHPIIQAGIIQPQIINIVPFDNGNGRIARLLSYLMLYRGGYDMRDMLILEEYYKRDIVTYKRMVEAAKLQGNLTIWLEYFTYGIGKALEKTLKTMRDLKFAETISAPYWKLSSRQRKIIEKLENPDEKITNKDLQKSYGISQITASRDLAHLVSLGLLLAHGKGRSVFYTRV